MQCRKRATQRRCEHNLNSFSHHLQYISVVHSTWPSRMMDNTCTNIQQVAEEEEDTPHVDTWHNARVWVNFLGDLH